MITILSPAKSLNFKSETQTKKYSISEYLEDSEKLISELRKYSPYTLSDLMKISDGLGELNFIRYQNWTAEHNLENSRQAILAFNGEVYNGLDALSLSQDNLLFAQKHLRILSGLYGVLRPLDLIQPYRLEMGTKLAFDVHKNLYEFWGNKLSETLKKELSIHDYPYIVNLASKEYNKAAKLDHFTNKVITPYFKEYRNGTYKIITVYAKKARGLMARYIIENEIQNPEEIKAFSDDRWGFSEQLSNDADWVFTR